MGKNWHNRFLELDGTPALTAAQAFQARLEDLQAKLAQEQARLAELQAQALEKEAAFEEALLGDDPAQAKLDLFNFWESISDCEKRIAAVEATLNRQRSSPEIEGLAGDLWGMAHGFRAALIELVPGALKELEQAQAAYLQVVAKIGKLGVAINRQEKIINGAALPFMPEDKRKYQPVTGPFPVLLDDHAVMRVYDPARITAPGINPDILNQPEANADSVLAVLRGE